MEHSEVYQWRPAAQGVHSGVDLSRLQTRSAGLRIAVLIPCFNEAAAIGGVVAQFRDVLPSATIYVFDNNSADGTAEAARQAGAVVRREHRQGKGNVVRRMFSDIDADVYVLVDGDGT
ncbi:MAG: glycosyltransferase, partial [Candidatus Obscuribacterales bacterium]|nr:glycosyltransferase [Steroidobacteraceae bacterium]